MACVLVFYFIFFREGGGGGPCVVEMIEEVEGV